MKSTDIPNGYIVRGPSGNNILVDFDDQGKSENHAVEVTITGWPDSVMDHGRVRSNILVLVHTVKGEQQMLVRRLLASELSLNGQPIGVADVARRGQLSSMAEKVYQDYVRELKRREDLAQQIEVSRAT